MFAACALIAKAVARAAVIKERPDAESNVIGDLF
jgi:hypothetical protein